MDGHFNNNAIYADLEIISPSLSQIKNTLMFKLDTGFTGDMCITYKEAFPLALTLIGFQPYTLADGSNVTFFECIGLVNHNGKVTLVSISIRPSGSLLMGVSLLKKLKLNVSIDFANEEVKFSQAKSKQPTESKPSPTIPSSKPPKNQ